MVFFGALTPTPTRAMFNKDVQGKTDIFSCASASQSSTSGPTSHVTFVAASTLGVSGEVRGPWHSSEPPAETSPIEEIEGGRVARIVGIRRCLAISLDIPVELAHPLSKDTEACAATCSIVGRDSGSGASIISKRSNKSNGTRSRRPHPWRRDRRREHRLSMICVCGYRKWRQG